MPRFVEHPSAPDRFPRTATSDASSRRFREMNRGIARRRRRSRWLIAAGVTAIAAAGFVRDPCRPRRPGNRCPAPADAQVPRVARLSLREPAADRERHVGRSREPPPARRQREASVSAEDRSGRSRALRRVPILGAAGDLARPLDGAARDRRASLPHRSRLERAGRRRSVSPDPGAGSPRCWLSATCRRSTPCCSRTTTTITSTRATIVALKDRNVQLRRSARRGSPPRTLGRPGGADRRARLVGRRTSSEISTSSATPARHASGRLLVDDEATLWAGYALLGAAPSGLLLGRHRALSRRLRTIGERLGPFDLTMIEVGQYDQTPGPIGTSVPSKPWRPTDACAAR